MTGHSLEATHQIFKVSKSTIQKWKKQLEETGNLEKKELHRSFRKIDPDKLRAYVEEHPDAYQSEMAEAFGCSTSGIQDALRRHKISGTAGTGTTCGPVPWDRAEIC